jgi:eukaryotic-like serine/threonine-protein kinase
MRQMDKSIWRQVETLFHRASELPRARQREFLEAECGGDGDLREHVEKLLAASTASDPLGEAIGEAARLTLDEVQNGDSVGPYRIEAAIGQGGMGAVYRAARQGEDFTQTVALKLIQSYLRGGSAGKSIAERFRRERQILARLEHPNIARLLDGGEWKGRLYLVMELVDGVAVDRYCQEQGLGVNDKVRLFAKICAAVAYAHGQLVVHRDIKPQNILVTADGTPKLLDFGIAKAMEEDEALTRASERILTPQYAAPEQILGQPVTTATDVYSLGALLYQLLTGKAPFAREELSGFALEKAICEQDPPPPSALAKVDRDLDAIVAKAMRKEPAQRYVSVAALEADLVSYLGGYPVEARKGNWRYRSAKFLRRRAGVLTASGLVGVALVGGAVATRIQQQKAERRFEDVRVLANSFLFEFHDSIVSLNGSMKARQMVVKRAVEYLDKLAAESGNDARLLKDLAEGYERVRIIQYSQSSGHLNDSKGALESAAKVIAMRKRLLEQSPRDGEVIGKLAKSNLETYLILTEVKGVQDAKPFLDEAVRLTALRGTVDKDEERLERDLAELAMQEAQMWGHRGNGGQAVARSAEGVRLYEKNLARGKTPRRRKLYGQALLRHGLALSMTANRPLEAVPVFEKAYKLYSEMEADTPADSLGKVLKGQSVAFLGLSYAIAGKHRDALAPRRESLRIAEEVAAKDPENAQTLRDVAVACLNTAQNEFKLGNAPEAVRLGRRMVNVFEQLLKKSPDSKQNRDDLASAREDLAEYIAAAGGKSEPLALMRDALEVREADSKRYAENGLLQSRLAHAYETMGNLHRDWKDKAVAGQRYRLALQVYEAMEKKGQLAGRDREDWERAKKSLAALGPG